MTRPSGLVEMVDDAMMSYDARSERGQYHAFQRAYGKENQAMLGLILLTVAWSYAAHVYGHGSVFTWFLRYVALLGSIYGLYRFLTYAHTLVEAGHQHYRTWEKSQHDAVKEARAKEKAKERRKRAKSEAAGDTKKPAGGREGRPEPEPVEKTVKDAVSPKDVSPEPKKSRSPEEKKQERKQKEAEERRQFQEAAKEKKLASAEKRRQSRDLATKAHAEAQQAMKQASEAAEEVLSKIGTRTPPRRESVEAAPAGSAREEGRKKEGNAEPAAAVKKAEDEALQRLQEAKQEAQRAQRHLAEAERAAKAARLGQAQAAQAEGRERRESRPSSGGEERRESIKTLLRPARGDGSGYVPPHMRDGFVAKPAKMPASSFEPRRSNPGSRPLPRPTSGAASAEPLPKPKPRAEKDPDGEWSAVSSPETAKRALAKQASRESADAPKEDDFSSNNVFAMLPEEDDGGD